MRAQADTHAQRHRKTDRNTDTQTYTHVDTHIVRAQNQDPKAALGPERGAAGPPGQCRVLAQASVLGPSQLPALHGQAQALRSYIVLERQRTRRTSDHTL